MNLYKDSAHTGYTFQLTTLNTNIYKNMIIAEKGVNITKKITCYLSCSNIQRGSSF
jgi:hypothetical protein